MVQTVFILGAGSSRSYGFPTGMELLQDICNVLKDSENHADRTSLQWNIHNQLRCSAYDPDIIKTFRDNLYYSSINSSDSFLGQNRNNKGFTEIGKFCIAYLINDKENEETLFKKVDYIPSEFIPGKSNAVAVNSWYAYLYNRLLRYDKDILNLPIKFITFNYDRSLEQFLFRAITSTLHLPKTEYNQLRKRISEKIIHVYGSLGDLENFPFNKFSHIEQIRKASENIRLIYEIEEEKEEILGAIGAAKRIVFLGFGYIQENLEVLGINNRDPDLLRNKQVYGTIMGIQKSFIPEVYKIPHFNDSISEPPHIVSQDDCYNFLCNHVSI